MTLDLTRFPSEIWVTSDGELFNYAKHGRKEYHVMYTRSDLIPNFNPTEGVENDER